jgi:hypothetical protein
LLQDRDCCGYAVAVKLQAWLGNYWLMHMMWVIETINPPETSLLLTAQWPSISFSTPIATETMAAIKLSTVGHLADVLAVDYMIIIKYSLYASAKWVNSWVEIQGNWTGASNNISVIFLVILSFTTSITSSLCPQLLWILTLLS